MEEAEKGAKVVAAELRGAMAEGANQARSVGIEDSAFLLGFAAAAEASKAGEAVNPGAAAQQAWRAYLRLLDA